MMDAFVKTEQLYEENPYCSEFMATVIACEVCEDVYNVILDKTAFFPEGGGQAADKGTLNGVEVLDVSISDGVIVHKLASEIKKGTAVEGKLNWELRFGRMQNHSGEHILSGIVHNTFGYNNVGFHMSESEMTVDFDGVLSAEDISEIEKRANRVIYRNLPITISHPTNEEAASLEYRSKLDNIKDLRIVTIEDTDCCACCAPHVSRTGEIGIIKIIDSTPNKGGTRLSVIAGFDALRDYSMLNSQNKQLMKTLSVSRMLVSDAAEKQVELINTLRFEKSELLKRLAWSELEPTDIDNSAYAFASGVTYDELRYCSNMLQEKGKDICLLFSDSGSDDYIYTVSSQKRDIRPLVQALNEMFEGKGGGRPNYAQGKIISDSKDKISEFIEKILKEI